jgi:hypothetical protein
VAGFEAETILRPRCKWECLGAEFRALVQDRALILELVTRPESCGTRAHVWEAIEVARNARVTDRDLRGYRSAEPGWIAERICCLSVAAEIRRMIMGSEPAFERVRTVICAEVTIRVIFPLAPKRMVALDSGRLTDSDSNRSDLTTGSTRTRQVIEG